MPDVWTLNPPKLKTALEAIGAKCGAEPRVIKDRKQEWTCHLDSPAWQGDVYIHHVYGLYLHTQFLTHLTLMLLLGLLLGVRLGKRLARSVCKITRS